MQRRTVGIDLAISATQVAQIFDDGRPVGRPLRFGLKSNELREFVAAVTQDAAPDTQIRAVMEPTGMAWFPVACWLQRAGVEVIRVKGQRVKALRRYLSEHTKSDLADANVLGALPEFGGRRLEPLHIPSPAHHALQRLTKQRHRYQEQRCASKRRLLDLIRWASPALEPVLPGVTTHLGMAILAEYFDPHAVLQSRRDSLRRYLCRHASGNHPAGGPFIEELIDALRAAARETLALHGERVDFASLQFELRQEVEVVRQLDAHVKALEQRSELIYQMLHPSDALRTIPGIGPTLAPLLIGVLGAARRFRSERHLRGFCGLFPSTDSSAGIARPRQRITQSGSDRVKRALYLAADVARKIDPDLAAVYWRLMVHKGHHHKQALCAVATRLVNRIHRVLKTGDRYVLRDLAGREITVAEGKRIVKERFTVPEAIRQIRRRQTIEVASRA